MSATMFCRPYVATLVCSGRQTQHQLLEARVERVTRRRVYGQVIRLRKLRGSSKTRTLAGLTGFNVRLLAGRRFRVAGATFQVV